MIGVPMAGTGNKQMMTMHIRLMADMNRRGHEP